jgi:hypothetical protein
VFICPVHDDRFWVFMWLAIRPECVDMGAACYLAKHLKAMNLPLSEGITGSGGVLVSVGISISVLHLPPLFGPRLIPHFYMKLILNVLCNILEE